jgi:hypothetical protein
MKLTAVNSSCINGYAYDPQKKVFEIQYKNGQTYDYLRVPSSDFKRFIRASSKGEFINHRIKKYRFVKVTR